VSVVSFPAAFERYRSWCKLERGLRPATISSYRKDLYGFHAHLDGRPWWKATPRDLARYLDRPPAPGGRAKGGRLAANTRAAEASAVKSFFRWAHVAGLVGADRMRSFAIPKGGRPRPRALPLADVRTVLTAASSDPRLEVMCALAYYCGLRIGEIARARIEDLRLAADQPMLAVPEGKGGHPREVPVPAALAAILAGYLARPGTPGAGPLLENRRHPGEHVSPGAVGHAIADHMHALGIAESAHALRHSYATEALKAGKGANLYSVSKALGHASTQTTESTYVLGYSGEWAELAGQVPDPRASNGHRPLLEPAGLAALVPVDVADQLAAATATLERLGPEIARAVETLQKATTAAWLHAMGCSRAEDLARLDEAALPTDEQWEQAERALGIDRGWAAAHRLAGAMAKAGAS
jgi:site-specific recombinase XerD